MNEVFRKFSSKVSHLSGAPIMFIFALICVAIWIITGPVFNFSNAWQLFINSFTNVVTFLMVFVIQNSQNRETKAIQLKLDELILSNKKADNRLVNVENLPDQDIKEVEEFVRNPREPAS